MKDFILGVSMPVVFFVLVSLCLVGKLMVLVFNKIFMPIFGVSTFLATILVVSLKMIFRVGECYERAK